MVSFTSRRCGTTKADISQQQHNPWTHTRHDQWQHMYYCCRISHDSCVVMLVLDQGTGSRFGYGLPAPGVSGHSQSSSEVAMPQLKSMQRSSDGLPSGVWDDMHHPPTSHQLSGSATPDHHGRDEGHPSLSAGRLSIGPHDSSRTVFPDPDTGSVVFFGAGGGLEHASREAPTHSLKQLGGTNIGVLDGKTESRDYSHSRLPPAHHTCPSFPYGHGSIPGGHGRALGGQGHASGGFPVTASKGKFDARSRPPLAPSHQQVRRIAVVAPSVCIFLSACTVQNPAHGSACLRGHTRLVAESLHILSAAFSVVCPVSVNSNCLQRIESSGTSTHYHCCCGKLTSATMHPQGDHKTSVCATMETHCLLAMLESLM